MTPPILKQYWRIAVRWRWLALAIVLGVMTGGLLITLLIRPQYTSTSLIEISRQQDQVVKIQGVEPDSNVADLEFYQTQYSLLQARSLAESVASKLHLADDQAFFAAFGVNPESSRFLGKAVTPGEKQARRLEGAVKLLRDGVSISPIRGSRLVNVSFTSGDPAVSQRLANAWATGFIEGNLARRYNATSYARTFLEGRLDQLRQRLEVSERALVAYAARQRIINISAAEPGASTAPRVERSLANDDLVALNESLSQAKTDRIRAQSRLPGQGLDGHDSSSNPLLATLRQRRAEAAADYAKIIVQFEPAYPAARALASQVATLDQAIAAEQRRVSQSVNNDFREAEARERALAGQVGGLKDALLDLRGRSIQYGIYQRDVDTNRQLYDGLLQRYKEIGVAGGVGTNNVVIVDGANRPKIPSSPHLGLNLLLAFAAGMALSALVIFALEQIDEQIKDPSDVERSIGLPLLGTIPKSDKAPREALQERRSAVSEAYLSVQASLHFATSHGVPRSLAVTSTQAGEGKSTSAYAIARSLARSGRKVVLVDCDMRSPSVNTLFDLSNKQGTSNFLAGEDRLDTLLITDVESGLALLLAGPVPPNAAELLTGPRFPTLIDRLLEQFDHVVIDSPPVLGLADGPLIASVVEGLVFASEANGPRSGTVRMALGRLRSAGANLLGVILTKFDASKAHYGYGYDYGYNYGAERSTENS